MTSEKDVTTRNDHSQRADTQREWIMRPAVDIFENGESISLIAELPGVPQDGLALEVDGDTLTIRGDIKIDMPDGMESLYADVRSTCYQRAFTLSGELNTADIEAKLDNGLLTVDIPKRDEVRPRRIEITAG